MHLQVSTTRGSEMIVPRLRGVSHAAAFFLAVVAAVAIVALAPTGRATVSVVIYGAALAALFGGSALYHRWPGPARFKPVLQRIDHSTIFVFIAASYTPIALMVLHGALAWVVLGLAWVGAAAGAAGPSPRLLPRYGSSGEVKLEDSARLPGSPRSIRSDRLTVHETVNVTLAGSPTCVPKAASRLLGTMDDGWQSSPSPARSALALAWAAARAEAGVRATDACRAASRAAASTEPCAMAMRPAAITMQISRMMTGARMISSSAAFPAWESGPAPRRRRPASRLRRTAGADPRQLIMGW